MMFQLFAKLKPRRPMVWWIECGTSRFTSHPKLVSPPLGYPKGVIVEHLISRVSLKIMINLRLYEETLLVLEIHPNKMPRETRLFSF